MGEEKRLSRSNIFVFVQDNVYLILYGILAGMLSYGYEMVHFTLTIDEEANWNRNVREVLVRRIADGRFFLGFLKQMQPRMFLPFWSTAVFLILIVAAGVCIVYLYQDFLTEKVSRAIAVVLFVSLPIHAFYVMFSIMSAETGLGYVIITLAAAITFQNMKEQKRFAAYLAPAGMVALAGGIYQAFLVVYAALVCGYMVLAVVKDTERPVKKLWRMFGGQVLFTVSSSFLYLAVSKFLQLVVTGSRGYVESFIVWGSAPAAELIKNLVKGVCQILFSLGDDRSYGTMFLYTILTLAVLIAGSIKLSKDRKGLFVLCLAGLLGINFAMSAVAGQILPTRTFLTFPVFAAVITALTAEQMKNSRLRAAMCIMTTGLVLYQSAVCTDLFWANVRSEKADEALLAELAGRVGELGHGYVPDIPVVIICETKYRPYTGTFGFSYFQLGDRVYNYLSYHGIDYLRADAAQMQEAYAALENMPVFPAEGSVVEIDGMILVNMLELKSE